MSDTFIFTEHHEEEPFDPLSFSKNAPFTQSSEYRQWQKGLGREVKRFLISRSAQQEKDEQKNKSSDGEVIGFFQLIKFDLPFRKNLLYCPYGPIISDNSPGLLSELLPELKKYLLGVYRGKDTVFIKLDFTLDSNGFEKEKKENLPEFGKIFQKYFKKPHEKTFHSAYMQPRVEWYLGISDPEENLLKKMHEKTRYAINLAARKGIQTEIIEKNFKKYFENFYSLLCETAGRNKFSLHPKKYYETIFNEIEKVPGAFLSIATFSGKILVINLVQKYGSVAHFIFGGSSGEQRNIYPSHRAHWAGIVHAKKIGCKSYNFGGVTEEAGGKENRREDLASLSSFKKKFGGYSVLHNYCYDLIIKRGWYSVYVLRKILKSIVQ